MPKSGQRRMLDRRKGYEAAIRDQGLKTAIEEISFSASPEQIKEVIGGFLRRNTEIDALLFADNNLAFSGIDLLGQLKRRISDDLAVIGFDDNDHFPLFSPAITVVAQPLDEMVDKMLQCINDHPVDGSTSRAVKAPIVLPSRLIIRQSSGRTLV
jgi:LacI family transcriptional regulator, galactose operon repressor